MEPSTGMPRYVLPAEPTNLVGKCDIQAALRSGLFSTLVYLAPIRVLAPHAGAAVEPAINN